MSVDPVMDGVVSESAAWGGFQLLRLGNRHIEMVVAPELGAKIVSLKNLSTGREWMYWPTPRLKLFRNGLGDDYSTSTMAGWDECLPTIAPCAWKGKQLPDHGEVWSQAWEVDKAAAANGVLAMSVQLAVSALKFTRVIELCGNNLYLGYTVENLSAEKQEFLYAMHPLLSICPGDRLELTAEVREKLAQEEWLDSLELGARNPAYAKVFAGPLREGRAGVANGKTQDRLTYEWDTELCATLGLWLTRGGWNGHHHLALEVTNAATDYLTEAVAQRRCGVVEPNSNTNWNVKVRVEP